METFVKIGLAQISLAAQKFSAAQTHIVSVKFYISQTGLQFVPSLKKANKSWTRKSNTPPHDKFRSNMRRLKRFILFWNGSNDMNTEIERRTNEHHITDHIELSFSTCHVWLEKENFVANIFLPNFSQSEWNIGLLVRTCFISEMIRITQSSCLPGVWKQTSLSFSSRLLY